VGYVQFAKIQRPGILASPGAHRAVRAEYWLQTIQKEIEEKLIAPRSANTPEQTSLPKDAEL
jgi:hypothetical protein